jgi:hypothetical protein
MPYPVFVIIGTVLWQTFTEALNSPLLAPLGVMALIGLVTMISLLLFAGWVQYRIAMPHLISRMSA